MSSVSTAHFASVFSGLSSLHHSECATDAFEEAIEVATTLFETSVVTLWVDDEATETFSRVATSGSKAVTKPPPGTVRSQLHTDEQDQREDESGATAGKPQRGFESREPFESELFVTVGRRHVMSIGRRDGDAFDDHDRRIADGLATSLETTLGRFESTTSGTPDGAVDSPAESRGSETSQQARDADALRRLHDVTAGTRGYEDAVDDVLELGCDHFGLERGILSRVDGIDYEIRSARDPSGTFADGAVLELGETICETTIEVGRSEAVAFADIETTEYRDHPAATAVGAYIAAPVIVDGEPYGTVNFSSETARPVRFRAAEREFVTLIAQWLGTEIEQRRRRTELERYETILEAVGDPVYALDSEGRFTFVNEAAQREFGYGDAVIGDTVDVAMAQADVDRVRTQLLDLHGSDDQSTTAQFELETADGERRIVENRLAVIGDAEFRGSAGVLRDITDRERRRRKLEAFQEAIEDAVDGVSILDGDEYVYVDQTHVDMYGFDSKDQLLGNTWRQLYDEAEVERLEAEAFPALETDGHWNGRVTGTRPDGSQFPAELSLTIVDDGRLVCTVRDVVEREQRTRQLEEFQRAIESAEDGVAVLDGDEYEYVDQTHVDMYGFDSKDQLLGNTWQQLYDDAEVERLEAEAFPALESEGYWRGMVTGTRPDGSQFPAELSLTIVDGGRLVCTVRDETERQARKRELERQNDLFEKAQDLGELGAWEYLVEKETVYVTDKVYEIYGVDTDHEHQPERDIERFYHPDDQDTVRTAMKRAWAEGEPYDIEARITAADGTEKWVRTVGEPTFVDGDCKRVRGTIRDITERKTRQQELELKERAMDEANVGIQITDPTAADNPLVYINDGFERMTGYTSEEAIGKNPRFLQGVDTHSEQTARLREAIEADEPVSVEIKNYRKDGTPYWSRVSVTPVTDEDGIVANYVGIQQDVTKRKEREREAKARVDLLERIYEVTTDPQTGFEEKITGLLETGREYLDLPYGFLTQIEVDEDPTAGTQTILEAVGSHELLQPDESGPLSDSYCQRTTERDSALAVTNAVESERVADNAYEAFGLETYIGGNVVVNDEVYGTLCFASREPRESSFDGFERTFVSLLGQWAGYEIERRDAREELRQQQERLELTLSGTNTGIAEWDLQTDAVTWNETLVELVGRDVESIEEFRDAIHPDDREDVQRELEATLETGEPWTGEFRVTDEDGGDSLWLGTRATPVYGDNGDPVRVLATGTDISDRKAEERKRRRNEQRYETLLEAAPDPIFVADAETGEIVEVNAAAEEIRGQSRDALIGLDQAELHPEGDHDLYRESFEHSIGSSTLVSKLPDGTQPKLSGSDGEPVPVEINAASAQLPDGSVLYGVFRDISQRRERERELELKERAMDEANLGITISDPDREDNPLVYVNDGFVDQTGYTRADVLDRNCRFLQADDRDQPALDTLRDAIAAEKATTVELRNYRKNGEQFWNRLSVTPVYDEDNTLASYIGIQQDVTEEKTREKRMQALHGTTRELLGADDEDEAVRKALDTLTNELDFYLAGVYLREGDELVRAGTVGPTPKTATDRIERGETPLWEAIESGESVVVEDDTALDDDSKRGETFTAAYIPINERGVVKVGAADSDRLDWSEQRLVEVLAGNLASVLGTLARQRELFEERERFRLLTDSIDEYGFLTVDGDGVIQTWNAGASGLFGYETETAVGMSMGQLHPESDRESELPGRLLQQARIAGESAHEGWRVRADGSRFYADVRYAPLETDAGEFYGYAKIVRDMTENRRQRRRTERFVEESEDVVTILDPDGTLTYASGSAQRVFGYDPDTLVGENLFDYLHPDGREHAMETFFNCVEESESVTAECRLKAPDGEWFNIEGRCRNMLDDDAIEGILVYIRDVTGQKERARQFESIFNQTFQFTGLLEPDGTVVEVNDAALEFGGLAREDVVGNPFDEVSWWTHSETSREAITTALDRAARGNFVRYQADVMGTDGLRTIDFSVKPVLDDDGRVSLLVVEGRDITDQQQRGQHLAVLERVMRHNIRNDLTKLRGWTQMLYEAGDDARREETYGTLQRILDKWEKMTERTQEINQLLDAQTLHESHRSLTAIVDEAVERANASSDDAHISVDVDTNADVSVPSALTDAIDELLSNAVAVSGTEPVTLSCHRPDNTWLELTIGDSGPGLPDAEAAVLESGEETALSHGQGLGLWFVRMVVTEIGGSLSADVREDGTAITLRIPTKSANTEVSTDQ